MKDKEKIMIGIYEAKIKDYTVSESGTGNPQVQIRFMFDAEGAQKELTWYGSFVGGAKDITLKSLLACGLQPQFFSQLHLLREGVASNLLDLGKVLSIDVQEEPKQDGSGMRTIIRWVNDPNTAPAAKKIDEAKNHQYFGSMGFEADLIRLAGEMGIPLNNGGQATMGAPANMQNTNPHGQAPQQQMPMNQAPMQQQQMQQAPQQQVQQQFNQVPAQQAPQQQQFNQAPQQAPAQQGGFKAPF